MKKILYTFLISALPAVSSCSFLEREPNVVVAETYYNNEEDAVNALNAVYGVLNCREIYGEYYSMCFSLNDDLSYRYGNSSNDEDNYTHNASNPRIYEMWYTFYQGINVANNFLEAMEVYPDFDNDGTKRAQARFLRAFYHYLLAQTWGDVPLVEESCKSYKQTLVAKTPQKDVLAWSIEEMQKALEAYPYDVEGAPARLSGDAMRGIIARASLFAAGVTVNFSDEQKYSYLVLADRMCQEIISSGRHTLNPDYTDIFKRMIGNVYDTDYRDSIWEVDFYGDRAEQGYTNGFIGCNNGLYSSTNETLSDEDYVCNFAYGRYCNSMLLWDMYMTDDRTKDEKGLSYVTDLRQEWNVPPYNYIGRSATQKPLCYPYGGNPNDLRELRGCIDKTPYVIGQQTTNSNPLVHPAGRYFGTFRREVQYEGVHGHTVATAINYPLLRYSDVLLMYAETQNELNGGPTRAGYDAVKLVRDRAGIGTNDLSSYNKDTFLAFLQNERGRELPFESLRKYDLIRWGIFLKRMQASGDTTNDLRWDSYRASFVSTITRNVRQKHIVLPIPSIELGVNKLLKQNPMW